MLTKGSGCFGGMERVVFEVAEWIRQELKTLHDIDDPIDKYRIPIHCRHMLMHTRCWEEPTMAGGILSSHGKRLIVPPEVVRKSLGYAFQDAFQEMRRVVRESSNGTLIVISGGSALHQWVKENILKIGAENCHTTRLIYNRKDEKWKNGKPLVKKQIQGPSQSYQYDSNQDLDSRVLTNAFDREAELETHKAPQGRPPGFSPVRLTIKFAKDHLHDQSV